ncbi:MAG: conjugal transfer protein TraF [Colwellia sp.]|jgi:Thioredoxin.
MSIKSILFSILFVIPVSAISEDLQQERGYFWGEEYEIENEKSEKIKTDEEKYNLPPLPPVSKLIEMHPEDLRKMEKAYLDQAVWKRDEESVTEYYTLVKAFRAKSRGFAAAHAFVTMNNPGLSTNDVIPTTKRGITARKAQAVNDVKIKLLRENKNYGLIVFVSPMCKFCTAMYPIYNAFKKRHGWDIAYVNADEHPEMAADFNVSGTPTVAMIKADSDKRLIVSNGVSTLPNFEENIYRSTRYLNGEINLQQFLTSDYQINTSLDPARGLPR